MTPTRYDSVCGGYVSQNPYYTIYDKLPENNNKNIPLLIVAAEVLPAATGPTMVAAAALSSVA